MPVQGIAWYQCRLSLLLLLLLLPSQRLHRVLTSEHRYLSSSTTTAA